jgi:uncharacterized damage-inducible protein DinB
MNHNDIATLTRFNFWANDRLLAACERLTQDEFTRPVEPDPGWGSLRGVLVHILDTEFGWRSVLQDQDADIILEESGFRDLAALKARFDDEKADWMDFVSGMNDEDLEKTHTGDPQTGPKAWQTIIHVITHGIQHRGEAAMVLTGYGYSPGELDFDEFLRENPT